MLRDKDLFISGTDENTVTPEDIALAESEKENLGGEEGTTVTQEATTEV